MTDVKNRADIAHETVVKGWRSNMLPLHLVTDYLSFPCHLCGKPMDTEAGECHAKCVAEEQADHGDGCRVCGKPCDELGNVHYACGDETPF